jgi:hypothetical protein
MNRKKEFQTAGNQAPPSLAREFWQFLFENKKWWMLPIVLVLAAVAGLMLFAGTGAAPFIYTLF